MPIVFWGIFGGDGVTQSGERRSIFYTLGFDSHKMLNASYLDIHLEIDSEWKLRNKLYDIRDDLNFPLWTFHLYVAIFQQHLYMEYISLSWYDIPELVVPIMISLIEGWC